MEERLRQRTVRMVETGMMEGGKVKRCWRDFKGGVEVKEY